MGASAMPHETIPTVTRRVRDEQVSYLYRFPARVLANLINAALVAGVIWEALPAPLLATWLGLVCLISLLRFAHGAMAKRRRPSGRAVARFASGFLAGSWATGALWGAASSIVWLSPEIGHHVLIAFAIAGTTAAASFMSHSHLPSAIGFLVLAVLPMSANFLAAGDALHLIMAIMGLLFLVLMIVQTRHYNRQQREALLLKEEVGELAADLASARDGLEEKVTARTAELAASNDILKQEMAARTEAETRLRQAQKMDAVGQLTGGIAHDFNNLLGIILGNLDLASAATRDNQSISLLVRRALDAAERGSSLVQRLLAFSRRQTLMPQVTDLNALTKGMIELLTRSLGSGVAINTRLEPSLWRSSIDPGQLESALLNLAINARDAMPDGGTLLIETGNVTIDAAEAARHAELQPGDYARVSVTDNGTGMPPEIVDRVLEPFFTTKGVGKGTGLGLSMVYGFVKQSGGHVTIRSAVGQGTTIELYLPRAQSDVAMRNDPPANRLAV